MRNRGLSGLLLGLVAAIGCGGGGAGKIMADTPVLPYEAPDTDELAGIDPDEEPAEEAPAEAPAPAPAPTPAPAPAATPAPAPAPKPAAPAKAPAKAKPAAKPAAAKNVPGAEQPPAQNPQK